MYADLSVGGQSAIFSGFLQLMFLLTGTGEDEVVKSKKVFRSQTVTSQNPETELLLDGDDDAVSLLQEKEVDNLGGKSTCQHLGEPRANTSTMLVLHLSAC